MFILSVTPIQLSINYDSRPAGSLTEFESTERRIYELEALLSSMILQQDLGVSISSINDNDFSSIKAQLEAERAKGISLGASYAKGEFLLFISLRVNIT